MLMEKSWHFREAIEYLLDFGTGLWSPCRLLPQSRLCSNPLSKRAVNATS